MLFLSSLGETSHAFEIADDSGCMINILTAATHTDLMSPFISVAALIAEGDQDIRAEIIAACASGYPDKIHVLPCGKVFLQVQVKSRTAIQILAGLAAVQNKFINGVHGIGFHRIQIGIVTIARYKIAVLAIPLGILDP